MSFLFSGRGVTSSYPLFAQFWLYEQFEFRIAFFYVSIIKQH